MIMNGLREQYKDEAGGEPVRNAEYSCVFVSVSSMLFVATS